MRLTMRDIGLVVHENIENKKLRLLWSQVIAMLCILLVYEKLVEEKKMKFFVLFLLQDMFLFLLLLLKVAL
jgi:hypothetical protein